jgi:hypothetical protein
MNKPHKYIAVGVDAEGAVWTYTFPLVADAQDFVDAVADEGWSWDIRLIDGDWTVAEAIANHKDAINWE